MVGRYKAHNLCPRTHYTPFVLGRVPSSSVYRSVIVVGQCVYSFFSRILFTRIRRRRIPALPRHSPAPAIVPRARGRGESGFASTRSTLPRQRSRTKDRSEKMFAAFNALDRPRGRACVYHRVGGGHIVAARTRGCAVIGFGLPRTTSLLSGNANNV